VSLWVIEGPGSAKQKLKKGKTKESVKRDQEYPERRAQEEGGERKGMGKKKIALVEGSPTDTVDASHRDSAKKSPLTLRSCRGSA